MNDRRAHLAWRGATLAAGLNAAGWPLQIMISRSVGAPVWPGFVSGGIGLVLLAVLLAQRKRPDRRIASIAFLINTAAVVSMLWVTHMSLAPLGARWAPFQTNKLGAITVGLLTPEPWVGVVSIAAYAGAAVLQWYTFSPALRAQLSVDEPWATCAYAVFGIVLLVQTSRRYALERRIAETERDAAALDRLARCFLAIRDMSSSAMQTIETVTAATGVRHPEVAEELEPVARALDRMRELDRILARYEANIHWREGDEAFDARDVISAGGA